MNNLRKQFWFANHILSALSKQSYCQYNDILTKTQKLQRKLQEVTAETRKIQKANDRQWLAAAGKSKSRLERTLSDLPFLITNAKQLLEKRANRTPTFRDLLAEFNQLEDEFCCVKFDFENKTLSVTTESISLDDIYLGEFKIQLYIDKLTEAHRMSPYYVIALDPHPAATSSDVTHPHVSNDILCEGDGHVAICTALQQGRFCDFFTMIVSILNTYNPDSPYVPLNEWEGRPCFDCGFICDSDESYYCSCCDNDFCSECSSYCRMCEETICLGCGSTCDGCDSMICSRCVQECSECGCNCCDQCIENGICNQCQEERDNNEEEQTEETQTVESETQFRNAS